MRMLTTSVYTPVPRFPPPPGFGYLSNRTLIVSPQIRSASQLQSGANEIEQLLINISRNREAMERNIRQLRLSRQIDYEESAGVEPPNQNSGFLSQSMMEIPER